MDVNAILTDILDCVCNALVDAERPACECFITVGQPFINGLYDCNCATGDGELNIYINSIYTSDRNTLDQINRVLPCQIGTRAIDATLVLTRCFPTIGEHGEIPDPGEQAAKANGVSEDIAIIWKALTCCDNYRKIIRAVDVLTPQAGRSQILVTLTVAI